MQQEVILKLKPRPLRLVYLVNTLTDLNNAVKLYTHLWGGFSNAIFPVPNDAAQNTKLQNALHSINPDYIFLPENELPASISEVLNQFPSLCLKVPSEKIEEIGNSTANLFFPTETLINSKLRDFPHVVRVLNSKYRDQLNNSNLLMISCDSLFSPVTYLQFGIIADRYEAYLNNSLSAQLISINSIETLLKVSLLIATGVFKSPVSITATGITHTESSGWYVQNHRKVFNLFLYESGDIQVAASFWNSRRLDIGSYSNKLILPKEEFIKDMRKCIILLSSFLPSMCELQIYIKSLNEEALALANNVGDIFGDLERNVFVKVLHQDIGFDFYSGSVYSSKTIITTREISSLDKSIRFSPVIPSGYENSNCAFGYDAEIEFSSGKSLSMPFIQSSAILLSNSIEQVRYSENHKHSLLRADQQQKTQSVRFAYKGVTGIAVSNEECRILFPESKEIIVRWLRSADLLFKVNDHTRYAQGFIKRFGGFDKTRHLIGSRGINIFIALDCERASKCGFKHSEIVDYLKNQFNLAKTDAKNIVDQNLPALLKTGLIYRGYPLQCPTCGLQDWYKLEKVNELVECTGCAEHFQLPKLTSLEFAYKPNELAARFLRTGGQAILSTAVFLSYIASSGDIQLGGNLICLSKRQPFAEIDLFILVKNFLIIAECKSYHKIDEKQADKIVEHLEKVVETAILIDAKVVILGITTLLIDCDLFSLVAAVAQNAIEKGIGVHLLINNKFYLWGERENEVTESWQLSVEVLLIQEESFTYCPPISVGEPVIEYNWHEEDQLINEDLFKCWEQELFP